MHSTLKSIIRRYDGYYLVCTQTCLGDYPYQTSIFSSEAMSASNRLVYQCFYRGLDFAVRGHENLVKLWPGEV
jgi:hypothetical protein